jgi:RimJ/RimL family protein N-acetyltransferase
MLMTGSTAVLRPLELADAPLLKKWFNDGWLRGLTLVRYPGSVQRWEEFISTRDKIGFEKGAWFIIERADGSPVGLGAVARPEPENGTAELTLLLGEQDARSQGIGLEAGYMLVRFGFDWMNLRRLFMWVISTNEVVIEGAQRAGFKIEGRLREAEYQNGEYYDKLVLGLLKHEFVDLDDAVGEQPGSRLKLDA